MPTVYLIDFENVGNKWADVLGSPQKGDTVVLFYSDNSPKAMLDQMEKVERLGVTLKFRRCEPGHNGLDFQLSSELGYLIGAGGPKNYHIISDDAGYDVLASYWDSSGVRITRSGAIQGANHIADGPRQELYDALDQPMHLDGLTRHERSHVLGCARACLNQYSDPAERMRMFERDTVKLRGRHTMERMRGHVVQALESVFSS